MNDPINPLVLTVKELDINPKLELKKSSIFKFFENHHPKNLAELFFLDIKKLQINSKSRLDKLSQYTSFYPWHHKYPQKFLIPGMFGPKDISFPKSRFVRLKNLIFLIRKYGFKADESDKISGYKLLKDDDYRSVITAGAHRASVLKSLFSDEYKYLDVSYDNLRVKEKFFDVRLSDINIWPGVKSGYISREEAEELFMSFFLNTKFRNYET